jgi:hypothetical protein
MFVFVIKYIVWSGFFHAILKIKVNLGMCNEQVNSLNRALLTSHHQNTLLIFTLIDRYF